MGKIWAVANQKGGVGKSSVAVNVAVTLGGYGRRVLVCDLDPQGNAGDMLGVDVEGQRSWVEVYTGQVSVRDARVLGVAAGVDLVCAPENSELAGVELGLVNIPARERWLARVLEDQHDDYDLVVLDCPPSLGQLTTNALVAADRLIAPVKLTDAGAVKGINQLHRTVLGLRDVGFDVALPEVILNFVDNRRLTVQAFREIVESMGLAVLNSEIPITAEIDNSSAEGRPIVVRRRTHVGAHALRCVALELDHAA